MTEKIYSEESEQAILAYILRNPAEYPVLADIIKGENFGWFSYGQAWGAMGKLHEKGLVIDAVTLGDELERSAGLDDFCNPGPKTFTGRAAISKLRDVETSESGTSYAITIQDYSVKRELLDLSSKMATWAHNGRTAPAIIADAEMAFSKFVLHSGKIDLHTVSTADAAAHAIEAARSAATGKRTISTGLVDLDKYLYPQKTEFIIVGARPKQGKSSLLATIALNTARMGKRVKIFQLEGGHVQLAQRLLGQISGVSAFNFMRGKLNEDEWQRIGQAEQEFRDLNIEICDLPAIKIGQVRTESRKSAADLIMLDYIQLANSDSRNERRDLDVGEVSRGLAALAIELDIPIIAAAQLGRAVEQRADKTPILADLRESGSLEADASSVVFINRKESTNPGVVPVDLIVAAHRNGPTGVVDSFFMEETMRFVDAVTTYEKDFARPHD